MVGANGFRGLRGFRFFFVDIVYLRTISQEHALLLPAHGRQRSRPGNAAGPFWTIPACTDKGNPAEPARPGGTICPASRSPLS
jgi:hypothetical protein